MADHHRERIECVGELRKWLKARVRDGSLANSARISMPDLEGVGRYHCEVMVTQGGAPASPEPNIFQCWGL